MAPNQLGRVPQACRVPRDGMGFLYARTERYQGCKETTRIFRPPTQHSTLASPRRAGSTMSSFLACFRFNLEDRR
jgi:hypothetical protein